VPLYKDAHLEGFAPSVNTPNIERYPMTKHICREDKRYIAYVDGRKLWSTPVSLDSGLKVSELLRQGWKWGNPVQEVAA
jgi:hypothetical protein